MTVNQYGTKYQYILQMEERWQIPARKTEIKKDPQDCALAQLPPTIGLI